ncbi:hypothetical protein D0469_02930 [Peribacillus saganii]|uniref:Uncharacterized protein n=1 Tax=Peribacillus saganii TaxID=2303992 RepID=A0A372LRU8_9BACI|nr:hypothetical protein D0469_02930 [Peribacillus saganii]
MHLCVEEGNYSFRRDLYFLIREKRGVRVNTPFLHGPATFFPSGYVCQLLIGMKKILDTYIRLTAGKGES